MFSRYSETNLVTRLIFGMKAHLIDKHLLALKSRSSAKVKVKYQGHVSLKMDVLGALVFHKHILLTKFLAPPIVQALADKKKNVCGSVDDF